MPLTHLRRFWPIKPMLAKRAEEPFDSEEFIYELKWDGTRCIAYIEDGSVTLQNRRLIDITYRYPEFLDMPRQVDTSRAILDGEIIVLSEGVPNFRKLQSREQTDSKERIKILSQTTPAVYVVFDVLYCQDNPVMHRPLMERKELLEEKLRSGSNLILSETFSAGVYLYREAIKRGFEGIMAKRKDSPYLPGMRSSYWLKIKKEIDIDAIVCGWIESEKRPFASLILCLYSDKGLIHIGQVGTGFDEQEMEEILKRLHNLSSSKPPLKISLTGKKANWVRPRMVVRVTAMEWTKDRKLRAPVYLGIRDDKLPEECQI